MEYIKYKGSDSHPLFASSLGKGQSIIMLHGGGPDRQSIIPFAKLLANNYQIIFPDIRGYGESVCFDQTKHTWKQYAGDVISLIDHLGLRKIVVSGMGLGASIAERVAFTYPERIKAVVLISPETLDKEGQGSSIEEIRMMDKCAADAKLHGLVEAWKPFRAQLAPVINNMINEAIPRTNPESFAASMAIVHSQRLSSLRQLSFIEAPTLVIPGGDSRHSMEIGDQYLELIKNCSIGLSVDWTKVVDVDELASFIIPQIVKFLKDRVIGQ